MKEQLKNIWDTKTDIVGFFNDITKRFNQFETDLNSFADSIPSLPAKSIEKFSLALKLENDSLVELNSDLTELISVSGLNFPSTELIVNYQNAYTNAVVACDYAHEKLTEHQHFLHDLTEHAPLD